MSKKKKMIDIDTLLEDEMEEELVSRNSDMVFISATTETPKPDKQKLSRLERIEAGRINVEEPLFDGETNLDFGKVVIGNEDDALLIQKELLEQQNKEQQITKASDTQRDKIVDGMHGDAPEELVAADDEGNVIENASLEESELLAPETINKKVQKKANSRAVQDILDGLMRE